MEWTTYVAQGRTERSLPGIVLDAGSLDGIDLSAERTNRVQVTATSREPLTDRDSRDLVEFLDAAACVLGRCAAGSTRWTTLVVTVRAESGSLGAMLVDEADALARSGALVMLSLVSLEEAAAAMPWADEDPEGFEQASGALRELVRTAIAAAAAAEPARSSIEALRAATGVTVLLDAVGEMDPSDFVPLLHR